MTPFTLEDHEKKYGEHIYGYVRYGKSWRSIVEKYSIDAVKFKLWCSRNKIRINYDESITYLTTDEAVEKYKKWKERRNYEKTVTKYDVNFMSFIRRKKKVKLREITIEERVKLNDEYKQIKRTRKKPVKQEPIEQPPQKKWKVEYKKLGKPMVIYLDVKTELEARKYCINNYNISDKAIKKVEYV